MTITVEGRSVTFVHAKAEEQPNKALHLTASSGNKRRRFCCFVPSDQVVVFVVGGR